MSKNFVSELKWRGMVQDKTPQLEKLSLQEQLTGYIGFDPTADSLHIGNLIPIMQLKHFQLAGHIPIALIGGGTAMIGDPSGKTKERKLLDKDTIFHNQSHIKEQLQIFLDFESKKNAAIIENNYMWLQDISLLDFLRNTCKHITINYMLAKDSVKNGWIWGFLLQNSLIKYYKHMIFYIYSKKGKQNYRWEEPTNGGNITTGIELIRRIEKKESFALTCPLITKNDGEKFGKTEKGNIWLDSKKTSPYQFYQYWINISDKDAYQSINIFTLLDQNTITELKKEHQKAPQQRILQKTIAENLTSLIHGKKTVEKINTASQILFNKETTLEDIKNIDLKTIQSIFQGIPKAVISVDVWEKRQDMIELLSVQTHFTIFPSKSEVRRCIQSGALKINKKGIQESTDAKTIALIHKKIVIIQKGKKNYFLLQID